MIFKFFSLKQSFLLWKYAFCKRYLTCTINMPSILKAMFEYHIGNAQTTLFLIRVTKKIRLCKSYVTFFS